MTQWFDEITLDRVAEDAGVTVQTVVRRFGGKEGLLSEAVKALANQINARRVSPPGDIGHLVENLIADYEQVGDAVIRLLALEPRHAALKELLDFGRGEHRNWVSGTFSEPLGKLDADVRERALDATRRYHRRLHLEAAAPRPGAECGRGRSDSEKSDPCRDCRIIEFQLKGRRKMIEPMSFLFTTWEGGGNVTPALEAVRKLTAHGHRVRFMSEECNRPEAEAVGATFVAWKRAPNRRDRTRHSQTFQDWAAATPQEGLLTVIRDVWCGPALDYAQDVIKELQREPADLVVTCEALFGVMAGCESIGQGFATLSPNISLVPLPGVPPLGPGLAPARDEQERAMHGEITRAVLGMFDAGLPALNAARAAHSGWDRSITCWINSGRPGSSCWRRARPSTSRPTVCRPRSATSVRRSAIPTGRGPGSRPGPSPMRVPS